MLTLKKLSYKEYEGKPEFWSIDGVDLNQVNIIVGKNSTGKTRLLNVIKNTARMFSKNTVALSSGDWELTFENSSNELYKYQLQVENNQVQKESLFEGKTKILSRSPKSCWLINVQSGDKVKIAPPSDRLVIQVRRDQQDYPYLEDIFKWSDSFYGFIFSATKPTELSALNTDEQEVALDSLMVVPNLLNKEMQKYGPEFTQVIFEDMEALGYPIETVELKQMLFPAGRLANVIMLKEKGLKCNTSQINMSSGMYRALATVIIVNHLLRKKSPCTLAIDDIGEGLDYDRSVRLINLVLQKMHGKNIQVLFTTNDRHLLNTVDIENWNILERQGHSVKGYNYTNSKKAFDDFLATGLSNFDLLKTGLFK